MLKDRNSYLRGFKLIKWPWNLKAGANSYEMAILSCFLCFFYGFFCFQSLLHASTNKLDRRHIFLNRTLNSCFDKENDQNFLNPQYSIQLWLLSNCILNFIDGHWIVERLNGAQEDKGCVDFTSKFGYGNLPSLWHLLPFLAEVLLHVV